MRTLHASPLNYYARPSSPSESSLSSMKITAQRSCSTVTRWRFFTQLFLAAIRCPDYTRLRGCLVDMSIKGCDTSVPGLIQHYSRTCSRLHGKFRCFPYITCLYALLSLTLACIAAPIYRSAWKEDEDRRFSCRLCGRRPIASHVRAS
jgi:hypothetical protein